MERDLTCESIIGWAPPSSAVAICHLLPALLAVGWAVLFFSHELLHGHPGPLEPSPWPLRPACSVDGTSPQPQVSPRTAIATENNKHLATVEKSLLCAVMETSEVWRRTRHWRSMNRLVQGSAGISPAFCLLVCGVSFRFLARPGQSCALKVVARKRAMASGGGQLVNAYGKYWRWKRGA